MHHLYDRGILNEEVVDVIVVDYISTRRRCPLNVISHWVLDYPGYSRVHDLIRWGSQSLLLHAGPVHKSILNPLKVKIRQAFHVDLLSEGFFGLLQHLLFNVCSIAFHWGLRVLARTETTVLFYWGLGFRSLLEGLKKLWWSLGRLNLVLLGCQSKWGLDVLGDTVLGFHQLVQLCLRLDFLYPIDISRSRALVALLSGFISCDPLSESLHGLLEILHSITVIQVVVKDGLQILIFEAITDVDGGDIFWFNI